MLLLLHLLLRVSSRGESNDTLKTYSEWRGEHPWQAKESAVKKKMRDERVEKNYASQACGAQVLESNPEASNPEAVLWENKDYYLNNPCEARKWLVVKLCAPIDVTRVGLSNLELFSSNPRLLRLSTSQKYPPSDGWQEFAQLDMDGGGEWNFAITSDLMIMFLRVDYLLHEGKHHFCPLTHLKVFGLTEEELLHFETVIPDPPPCPLGANLLLWSLDRPKEEPNGQQKDMASLLKLNGQVRDLKEAALLSEKYLDEMASHYNLHFAQLERRILSLDSLIQQGDRDLQNMRLRLRNLGRVVVLFSIVTAVFALYAFAR